MQTAIKEFEQTYRKQAIPEVRSGDSVRVAQTVREAGKERTQNFEGTIIRTRRMNSLTASMTVRKLSGGVGVEKSFLLHSPNVTSVQVLRRSKVRRNLLSYIRERQGKATRLTEQSADLDKVNIKEETKQQKKPEKVDTTEATAEKPTKKDKDTEAKAELEDNKKNPPAGGDKAAEKKAKAEEFRKSQEAKK